MALFHNAKDQKLPLLTRAYQVNPDDEEELSAFLKAEEGPHSWEWEPTFAGPRGTIITAILEAAPTASASFAEEKADHITASREELARVIRMAKEVMDSAQLRGAIRFGVITQMVVQAHGYAGWSAQAGLFGDQDEVPVKSIRFGGQRRERTQTAYEILKSLYRLVLDLTDEKVTLGRCPECNGVFVEQKPGQIYCSHRCAHRTGQRRRSGRYKKWG